jgi:hypothetical protein
MKKRHAKILSAAAVAFLIYSDCYAGVYSQAIYSGGVSYYGDHCIGTPPLRFGYSECSFSTDRQGYIIMVSMTSPGRTAQPGDTYHRQTEFYLGPISFSVPMRPLSFLLIIIASLLITFGFADMGWKCFRYRRSETPTD